MPMGNCDRMKKHISDYIEGTLDPTTRKEFEKNLEIYPELNTITKNISILPSILHQLPSQKCSEQFMVNLRKRIHSSSKSPVTKISLKKYSYAISFLVLLIIAVFGVNSIFLQKDDSSGIQEPTDYQIDFTEPNQIPIKSNINNSPNNDNTIIKTKDTQTVITDSLKIPNEPKRNNQAKQAKQTKIKESLEK
jgi:hypothetical protein